MKRFAIIYGKSKSELQKRAIEELSRTLLDYTVEYPICCQCDDGTKLDGYTRIYIGTKESNRYIKENSASTLSKDEEYAIKVKDGTAIIEGYDDAGVLYGVLDFYNKYITKHEHPDSPDEYWVNFLQRGELPDFEYSSAPAIKDRGLWTWGHVIYDYRGYIDNMMKLKMNRVVIWNDFLPTNAKEIVEYAHSRNVKVIWGFSWLWDTNCGEVDIRNLDKYSASIFEKYEAEYAHLGADGLYFQSFTELKTDSIDGVLIAEAVTNFVNRTAALFFDKYPSLELQFGLHATSVKDRLSFIEAVDPKIRIVWEDCGAFPFSYLPTDVEGFDQTKEFAKVIAKLRGDSDRFGVVTKGLVKLDWLEFKHPTAPQCIGVSSRYMKENRIERKRRIWRYIQSGWIANADRACEMMRELCRLKSGDLYALALVEDGMFEENVMYPVALLSEMLWDCDADVKALMQEVALRSYVTFA